MSETYDYIVVGGGSSGCIVAGELSSDPQHRVLLLECGQTAEENPETLRADGYKDAFVNDRVIWERFSEPQPGCSNKALFMGSGRGLGGSGSVNAMVYLRGSAADFQMWRTRGWSWDDVVSDFESLEQRLGIGRRDPTAFTETCINAAEAAGFRRKEDLNDGTLRGYLGYEWMNYRGFDRRSSYVAFVKPHLTRPNLRVITRARAQRIVFDENKRAIAVEYIENGHLCRAEVRKEVVMCAGALETPKLLMLSGVGPRHELSAHQIQMVAERHQVGRNFQDHPNVTLFFKGKRRVDCNYPQLYGFHRANPDTDLPKDAADTCYVFYPARSSLREALIRMLPAVALPQSLYHKTPLPKAMRRSVDLAFRSDALKDAIQFIYGIVVILGKPQSRGTVRLRSGRADDDARIDPAYLEHPEDIETMLRGVQLARNVAETPHLEQWGNTELFPGPVLGRSRKALEQWIRGNVMTTYHFSGTCRMGEDEDSVVDERLRLRGVSGVRVADASIIPVVPVSALNAPSMLVGYRAAKFIQEDAQPM